MFYSGSTRATSQCLPASHLQASAWTSVQRRRRSLVLTEGVSSSRSTRVKMGGPWNPRGSLDRSMQSTGEHDQFSKEFDLFYYEIIKIIYTMSQVSFGNWPLLLQDEVKCVANQRDGQRAPKHWKISSWTGEKPKKKSMPTFQFPPGPSKPLRLEQCP